MVDKDKNKGEFDEGFDDDFSDTNFDDISFEDASFDDTEEDAEYEGDDFESEEWGEGEENAKASGKKAKKQKSGGGGGLSFNTIVIIGAVVLGGGVLAFNVMRETGKAESARPAMFQSILGMSGIMDGTLFGDKEKIETAEETPQDQSQGFLNDPNMPIPATPQDAVPPQPAPIAPVDGTVAVGEPLTPMPSPVGEPSVEAPRGPEDALPVMDEASPTETSALPPLIDTPAPDTTAATETASAEDILKQAMANREQKQQEENDIAEPSGTEALKEKIEEKVADAKEKTEEVVADVKEDVKEIVTPEPTPIEEVTPDPEPIVPVAETPAPVKPVPVENVNNAEVAALSAKLDTLLKRMDQIEGDLDTVRESKGNGNTEALEKTVASLKKEIASIKERPVSVIGEPARDTKEEVQKPAPVKKKVSKPVALEDDAYSPSEPVAAPAPKASPAPAKAPVQTAVSGRWELRAAQPGRAWVSKSGERDMQAVAVGETLAGIGRITAITYQNGRWTVSGTQGTIQQ